MTLKNLTGKFEIKDKQLIFENSSKLCPMNSMRLEDGTFYTAFSDKEKIKEILDNCDSAGKFELFSGEKGTVKSIGYSEYSATNNLDWEQYSVLGRPEAINLTDLRVVEPYDI